MTNMTMEAYDAFRSIGINDEAARKAAGALSDNPRAIAELRTDMSDRFTDLGAEMIDRLTQLRTEQVVHRTMLGILLAGVLSVVVKLYV